MRPVSAELKFHRDTRNYSHHKVDPENARPEPGCLVIAFVIVTQRHGLEIDDQRCDAHRQLREQVMEGDGKGKVQAVNQQCAIHESGSPRPFIIDGCVDIRM